MWGTVTAGARAKVHSKNESVFFPGGEILVLALIGLAAPLYTRRLRLGLLLGEAGHLQTADAESGGFDHSQDIPRMAARNGVWLDNCKGLFNGHVF